MSVATSVKYQSAGLSELTGEETAERTSADVVLLSIRLESRAKVGL